VGVGKGDAVVIYLPMLMELPIAMLACARIGAVHSVISNPVCTSSHSDLSYVCYHVVMLNYIQVVFAGFSADAIAQRIIDCKPKVVITCNAVKRGLKLIPLKDIVDASLVESAKNGVTVGMHLPSFTCKFYLATTFVSGKCVWCTWVKLAHFFETSKRNVCNVHSTLYL
jgi:acetyl-CoA synthetase